MTDLANVHALATLITRLLRPTPISEKHINVGHHAHDAADDHVHNACDYVR